MKIKAFSVLVFLAVHTTVTSGIRVDCSNRFWIRGKNIPDEAVCQIYDVHLPIEVGDHLQFNFSYGSADTMAVLHIFTKPNATGNVTIPTEVFDIFPKLEVFSIMYANFIPPNTFRNASNLIVLILEDSRFSEIEEHTFDGLDKLEVINLNWDQGVSKKISGAAFSIPSLLTLYLRRNHLLSIGDDAFELPKLTEFDLSENNLTSLSDLVFSKLENLQTLKLDKNNLVHIGDALRNLPKIQSIDLSYNAITDIDLYKFLELPQIDTLDLTSSGFSCPLSEKPKTLSNRSLKVLNLSSNILKYACNLHGLSAFERLTHLDLSKNSISDIDLQQFAEFPHLQTLDLSSSGFSFLSSVEPKRSRNLSLKTLKLGGNNLKYACDLIQLSIFEALTDLDLSWNEYKNFIYGIRYLKTILPNLINLGFKHTKVASNNCYNVRDQFEIQNVTVEHGFLECFYSCNHNWFHESGPPIHSHSDC